MTTAACSFDLPNGLTVHYEPAEVEGSDDAFILELCRGDRTLSRTCSCNGVTRSCPKGKSPHCDCTKNPPVLTCA